MQTIAYFNTEEERRGMINSSYQMVVGGIVFMINRWLGKRRVLFCEAAFRTRNLFTVYFRENKA